MDDDQFLDALQSKLDAASKALQKLDSRLRRWRNKGHATDADVAAVKRSIDSLRGVYAAHGLKPLDIDSRAERKAEE